MTEETSMIESPIVKNRRKSKHYSDEEKIAAVLRVTNDGVSKALISRELEIAESTLRGWCKNIEKIKESANNKSSPIPRQKRIKRPRDENNARINYERYMCELVGSGQLEAEQASNMLQNFEQLLPGTESKKRRRSVDVVSPRPASEAPSLCEQEFVMDNAISTTSTDTDSMSSNEFYLALQTLQYQQLLTHAGQWYSCMLGNNAKDEKGALKSIEMDEIIASAEKLISWLEDCNKPEITRYQIDECKYIIDVLKRKKSYQEQDEPVDLSLENRVRNQCED